MEYAHIHMKDEEIYCIYHSDEDTDHTSTSVPDDCTLTIIEHLATTITYEMVDGVITPVTQQDMMDRMNDPDNTTVVAPA